MAITQDVSILHSLWGFIYFYQPRVETCPLTQPNSVLICGLKLVARDTRFLYTFSFDIICICLRQSVTSFLSVPTPLAFLCVVAHALVRRLEKSAFTSQKSEEK